MKPACLVAVPLMLVSAATARQPAPPAVRDASRYEIADHVLIPTPDGATLSATVVRPKTSVARLPALLTLDIYTDPAAYIERCEDAADHGYVGVIADTRGKRLSPGPIVPYEHEASDADAVIDWIATQPWSNGEVGMRGGSYSGFSAWAAAKRLPRALKTIAVSAAAIPGFGLPMYNNVFLNANYGWVFYVTDNKLLDEKTYGEGNRWEQLALKWFASGRAYRDIDRIDATPNPLLQRWLDHPAFDAYWQAMVPWKSDFAHILVPGRATRIPFRTTVVSRVLSSGSRLLVLLDVNKNRFAQVNYGTGKDVSDESVADAGEPLRVSWHADSFIEVPLGRGTRLVSGPPPSLRRW